MNVSRQKFLVLGLSKSGESSAKYILSKGGSCKLYEERDTKALKETIYSLIEMGGEFVTGKDDDDVLDGVDVVVVSPGVPINHHLLLKAKEKKIRISSELEFGFEMASPLIVGVTGTNGKTTTVSLIDHIFNESGIKSTLVGNVGVPVSQKIEEIKSAYVNVAEISSFQLESVSLFKPHIACVLNITPDHLERHYTMENYVFLKKRIVQNLSLSDYAVLNYDDETVRSFYKETKAKPIFISLTNRVNGAYRENGKLYYNGNFVIDQQDLPLMGNHNVYNVLFAITVCAVLGVSLEDIAKSIKTFKGVKHRAELVLEKNGIKYYNDSKSTNTASTMGAVDMMTSPTVLILGGSEKGEDYVNLFNKIKNSLVKHTIITGDSRIHMLDSAGKIGYGDMTIIKNFDSAIKFALLIAEEGDTVLFSPACASFDNFKNYEERGERFIKLVKEYT